MSIRPNGFWWVRVGPHQWDDPTKFAPWVPARWCPEMQSWSPWSDDSNYATVHEVGPAIPHPAEREMSATMFDSLIGKTFEMGNGVTWTFGKPAANKKVWP